MQPIQKQILPGITLTVVPTDKFKSNLLTVNFVFPTDVSRASYYALIPMILKHGCREYPNVSSFTKKMDMLYASRLAACVRTVGENTVFSFYSDSLNNRCTDGDMDLSEENVNLMTSFITDPVLNEKGDNFDGKVIRLERKNLIDRIKAAINNKSQYALSRCRQIMCEGEPYAAGALGTEDGANAVDESLLLTYYREMLATSRVEIIYVGDEPYSRMEKMLMPLYQKLGGRNAKNGVLSAPVTPKEVKRVTEECTATQGKLCMGFRLAMEDNESVAVFDAVLSGSPLSKLFMNVREKQSLCYYCSSLTDSDKKVVFVHAGIANGDRERAEKAILDEIAAMQNGIVSDKELDSAQKYLADMYKSVPDSEMAIYEFYLSFRVRGIARTLEEQMAIVQNTGVAEIVSLAKRLTPDTFYFLKGTANGGADIEDDDDAEEEE